MPQHRQIFQVKVQQEAHKSCLQMLLVSFVATKKINFFVIQLLYRVVGIVQSAHHEGSCQSFLHPVTAIFSTEIQPVQNLQKNCSCKRTNRKFF